MCGDYKHVEKTQNIFGGIANGQNRPKVILRGYFAAEPTSRTAVGIPHSLPCAAFIFLFIFIDRKVDAASRLCVLQDRPAILHGMGKPHPMPVGKT